jgi:hypothetical protein
MAVHGVFAGVAIEPTRFAEAGIIYQISYHAFREFPTVDEDQSYDFFVTG